MKGFNVRKNTGQLMLPFLLSHYPLLPPLNPPPLLSIQARLCILYSLSGAKREGEKTLHSLVSCSTCSRTRWGRLTRMRGSEEFSGMLGKWGWLLSVLPMYTICWNVVISLSYTATSTARAGVSDKLRCWFWSVSTELFIFVQTSKQTCYVQPKLISHEQERTSAYTVRNIVCPQITSWSMRKKKTAMFRVSFLAKASLL